jgi:uncharacterized protein
MLDSNVLLSALGTRGLCETVLQISLAAHDLIISEHILKEVQRNLTRKFGMPVKDASDIVRFLRRRGELVKPVTVSHVAIDSDDLPVLGTAVAGRADCLVTGDQALLNLKRFRTIPIFSPRKFHESFR